MHVFPCISYLYVYANYECIGYLFISYLYKKQFICNMPFFSLIELFWQPLKTKYNKK